MQQKTNAAVILSSKLERCSRLSDWWNIHARMLEHDLEHSEAYASRDSIQKQKLKEFFGVCASWILGEKLRFIWTSSIRSQRHCGPVASLRDMTARQQRRATHMVWITRILKLLMHSILIAAKTSIWYLIYRTRLFFSFQSFYVSHPRWV